MRRSHHVRSKRNSQSLVETLEARQLLSGVAAATAAGYIWPNTQSTSIRSNSASVNKTTTTTTTSAAPAATKAASGSTVVTSAASVSYNRAAALAYANANWNLVVSDGYFWINGSTANYYGAGTAVPVNQPNEASGIGDDCAHFVSSVIGTPGGGLTIPSRAGTYGEPGAARLDELLVGNSAGGYGTTYAYGTLVSSVNQLTPGDVIGYDWDGSGGGSMSGIDHTVVYIGNGEVDCHATSHLGANWTLGGAADYFFIHITLPDTNVPVTPTNSSPANNATVTTLTPQLKASAFSDAAPSSTQTAAEWQVYKGSTLVYDSGTDTTDKTSITVPSGKITSSGAYTFKVRYQDSYGDWGAYSTATSFTVNTAESALPATPTNTTPANNANVTVITPTLTASAFSDSNSGSSQAASEWQIYNGSTLVYDSGVDTTHLTSLTVPSGTLTSGNAYTWKVRYEDNYSNWSNYSTATSFTVNRALPATPTNATPANNANVTITPTLTASAFSDSNSGSSQAASEWQIYNGSTLVYDSGADTTHLTSLTVPSGTLTSGNTYTWTVRYEDNYSNWSSYSTATTFSTVNQPPVIAGVTLTPSDGNVTQGLKAYISSHGVSDPDGTVANVTYYLESNGVSGLQTGAGGDTLVLTSTDMAGNYLATLSTGSLSLGSHTYYAVATDNLGATSAPASTAINVVAAATNLKAQATSGVTMHVSWANNSPDGTGFILQRSDNGGPYVEIADPASTDTSFDDTGLVPGTSYTYRLQATSSNSSSTWVVSNTTSTWKPGDANGDGYVNMLDFLIIQNNFGKSGGWLQGDFDGNGVIDFNDFIVFQNAF